MNITKIFGPRFQKTIVVYFPFNFSFVIILLYFTTKIYSPNVPEKFVLKLIARNLPIIISWAILYAQTLYLHFDVAPKKSTTKVKDDIEMGPIPSKPLDAIPPAPARTRLTPLPSEFVEIDLGEGPSNSGLPGPPRPFLTCEV